MPPQYLRATLRWKTVSPLALTTPFFRRSIDFGYMTAPGPVQGAPTPAIQAIFVAVIQSLVSSTHVHGCGSLTAWHVGVVAVRSVVACCLKREKNLRSTLLDLLILPRCSPEHGLVLRRTVQARLPTPVRHHPIVLCRHRGPAPAIPVPDRNQSVCQQRERLYDT